MIQTLSKIQARRLVLASQGLVNTHPFGWGKQATLRALEHLSYVQIDPISVIARAHHHTLWNRNKTYHPKHLESLQREQKIFEYWSHAAAYLPMCDYPMVRILMEDFRQQEKHWHRRDQALMKQILQRIEKEGPLMAKDFEMKTRKKGGWGSHPIKGAIHELFMQGDLMIAGRVGIQKIFDLPARVLPQGLEIKQGTKMEFAHFLINRYLNANALATANEIAYLRKGWKPMVRKALGEGVEAGIYCEVDVEGQRYISSAQALTKLPKRVLKNKVFFLSPFDNVIIQRQRVQSLFEFFYQTEIYVPPAKRVYGYFNLPILWGSNLVGRLDPKADRQKGALLVQNLMLEPAWEKNSDLHHCVARSLVEFAEFNGCQRIEFTQKSRLNDAIQLRLELL